MNRQQRFSTTLVLRIALLVSLATSPTFANAVGSAFAPVLRSPLEEMLASGRASSSGEPLRHGPGLHAIYDQEQYRPLWTPEKARQLFAAIEASREDGLQPNDYHRQALLPLERRLNSANVPPIAAEDDILLTDTLLALAHDTFYGKVDPKTLFPGWNLNNPRKGTLVQPLVSALKSDRLQRFLSRLGPMQPVYTELKQALANYREVANRGGWPKVSEGPTLKLGMEDSRVEMLRRRLLATGELTNFGAAPQRFDQEVVAAVQVFQERHSLEPDGVVGKSVLAALNVPVEARIDQIRVNLERARWVFHEVPPTCILVDIAGFALQYHRDHQLVWTTKVVVGQPYHKTPIFRSSIRSMVLNPTWTVPTSIVNKEVVPAVIKKPGYLREQHLRIFDAEQREIAPAAINFRRYAGATFPYTIRQDAGADNALGRIKFLLPNPYDVYLHDTPSKTLFGRTSRAFSHGCIRVQHPLELGRMLLRDDRDNALNSADFDRILAQGATTTLLLRKPVPIILFYWTAQVNAGGVRFKPDLYQRDPPVLQALNGPPRVLAKGARAASNPELDAVPRGGMPAY